MERLLHENELSLAVSAMQRLADAVVHLEGTSDDDDSGDDEAGEKPSKEASLLAVLALVLEHLTALEAALDEGLWLRAGRALFQSAQMCLQVCTMRALVFVGVEQCSYTAAGTQFFQRR